MGKYCQGVLNMWEGRRFNPVETVRRAELGLASVIKNPVIVRGDPKGCWILEPGFGIVVFYAKYGNGAK